jgi:hypothetical protein
VVELLAGAGVPQGRPPLLTRRFPVGMKLQRRLALLRVDNWVPFLDHIDSVQDVQIIPRFEKE